MESALTGSGNPRSGTTMTLTITSLTHHAESVGETLNALRHAGIRDRRITVAVSPGQGMCGAVARPIASADIFGEIPHFHRGWLAVIALIPAVVLIHGSHAHWVGPAVVLLTALMLGCVAWGGLVQAATERRRQRCADLVEENGVLITVHDVDGAEAPRIERLLHDSGSEAVATDAGDLACAR